MAQAYILTFVVEIRKFPICMKEREEGGVVGVGRFRDVRLTCATLERCFAPVKRSRFKEVEAVQRCFFRGFSVLS